MVISRSFIRLLWVATASTASTFLAGNALAQSDVPPAAPSTIEAAPPAAPATTTPAEVVPGKLPAPPTMVPAPAPITPVSTIPAPSPPTGISSKFAATFYGFVEFDSIYDSTQSFNDLAGNGGIARSGSYAGDYGRMIFGARNSRLGFKLKGPETTTI